LTGRPLLPRRRESIEAQMPRLMLLDSNGLIYRGYHALPPLTTSKGELVNAVFGFCSILLRGIQDVRPEYVAACFDLPGPTFRHEQFAEYKATRTPMPDDLRSQSLLVSRRTMSSARLLAIWIREAASTRL
jgi:5'-3' exonuclease